MSLIITRIRLQPTPPQRPPVQLSVASATPSHSRPSCLGSGAVHSRPRCLSQSELHADHSLHSPQPPSTEGGERKCLRRRGCTCKDTDVGELKDEEASDTTTTLKDRASLTERLKSSPWYTCMSFHI
ncbi:hypothetical protein EYF80_029734 [Liparis tanakae]|uniref:Uncharacterized protein n=1 Tax=Liparis tanakae TaxID=230148 RepID=A0A4Z2H447_9TELE|nr:hypothetical protein EYF80_029734 [Liparis tanakae]